MGFVKVAEAADIKEGEGKPINAHGHDIALFNVDGKFYAVQNNCPHRQGPLGEGMLDGDVVTCPWHGWRFNVQTGKCSNVPTVSIKTYEVKIEAGDIYVNV